MKNITMELECPKPAVHPSIYFAYGSNLNMHDMTFRAPGSFPLCAATLPGYRLSFAGVLTVERGYPDEHVVGGLFKVSDTDIYALDRYESCPAWYQKRFSRVEIDGKVEDVFFYAIPEEQVKLSPPWGGYYWCCAEGYKDFGLDITELEAARARALATVKDAPLADLEYIEIPEELDLAADLDWTPRA